MAWGLVRVWKRQHLKANRCNLATSKPNNIIRGFAALVSEASGRDEHFAKKRNAIYVVRVWSEGDSLKWRLQGWIVVISVATRHLSKQPFGVTNSVPFRSERDATHKSVDEAI